MNRNKKDDLVSIQLITLIVFLLSVLLSIILTYNEKKRINNDKTLFNEKKQYYLNLFNRIILIIITLVFLYISYETYLISTNKKDKTLSSYQIITSILTTIAAFVSLYVSYVDNDFVSSIENPNI